MPEPARERNGTNPKGTSEPASMYQEELGRNTRDFILRQLDHEKGTSIWMKETLSIWKPVTGIQVTPWPGPQEKQV